MEQITPYKTRISVPIPVMMTVFALFFTLSAHAQVATQYTWSQSSGTYTAVGATGVNALFSDNWDDNDATVTLPFTFTYNGTTYTQIRVSSNGFMVFGNTLNANNSGEAYVSNSDPSGVYLSGSATNNGFAPFNVDLDEQTFSSINATRSNGSPNLTSVSNTSNLRVGMRLSGNGIPNTAVITNISGTTVTMSANASGNGSTSYTPRASIISMTVGTAPNREQVIQFTRATRYNISNDDISFQIRLAEGGGDPGNQTLSVVYGTVTATNTNNNRSPQVGIRTTTADFNSRFSNSDWTATIAADDNTDRVRFRNTVTPPSGLKFTWSPVTCSGTPTAGTISGTSPLCEGSGTTLTVTGNSTDIFGLSTNWFYSTTSGGPYTNAAGSGNSINTGNLAATRYYIATTSCSGGGSASTAEFAVIVDQQPSTANAGTDQSFCLSNGSMALGANEPSIGTGAWSILGSSPNTSASQLSDIASPAATFTPTATGTYTLRWTIGNGTCPSTMDDVVITVNPFAASVTQTFNSSGTFTVPAGVSQILVQAWGGGGAGGGSTNSGSGFNARGGAGGGGGAYVTKLLTVTPGSILNVSVAGTVNGNSGATGTNGQPSTIVGFESEIFAAGGSGGTGNTSGGSPGGGAGGTVAASQGDTKIAGENGEAGATGFGASSGDGGNGANGGGAGGDGTNSGSTNGEAGTAPGGGGSGSRTSGNNGNRTGGAGAAGQVIISYTPVPSISATATSICEGGSTTLTATGGNSYLWSPGGATSAAITVSPSSVTTYSVVITNVCSEELSQEITVQPLPSVTCPENSSICMNAPAFALSGGNPMGGTYMGTGVSNGMFDPAVAGVGIHTIQYSYSDGDCSSTCSFQVTVTADSDADGLCDPDDNCPNAPGQIGSSCDDGDASTGNDVLQADCTCAGELIDCLGIPGGSTLPGTACNDNDPLTLNDAYDNNCNCTGAAAAHSVTIAFQTDANGQQITWEILGENTNTVMCNGGGWYPPFADGISETCGLPDGDFKLRVYDSGGDGIANGGYILRMSGVDGARIIDNRYNFNNGSVSAIANDLGFTLPIGTDRLINSNCDKLDWLSNQFLVASPNAAVSAEWIPNAANSLQDADSGYEFWIFDPNGSYSFRRFRSHNQADGFGNVGATRACHMQINNWTAANHIPTGVLMNVRVRGRVNGVNMEWGPACRFKIDPVAAACPMTKLMDLPGNQFLSCGQFRTWASNSLVHARPVGGATAYQFRFRLPAENFEVVRTTASYFVSLGWTNAAPLMTGSTYEVDVRAFKNGQWCPWGDICSLTIGSPVQGGSQNSLHISNSTPAPEMMLWPNPNTDGQVRITLHGIEADVVMVEMMDLTGKTVMHRSFNMGGEMVIELPGTVTPGVYLVRAEAAGTVLTQRLIIQ